MIVTDLSGNALYVWAVTIYLLAATVTGPIYGKLSDLFGRRPMMMIGVSLFLLGSLLCGLSQEMWQLILFRGLQGLGAGAIFPISLAIIGDLFSPRERGTGPLRRRLRTRLDPGPGHRRLPQHLLSWHCVLRQPAARDRGALRPLAAAAVDPPPGGRAFDRLPRRGHLRRPRRSSWA